MVRQSGTKCIKYEGRTDIPLNDYGRRLAEETAEGMRKIPVDLGFTSPPAPRKGDSPDHP